ncbi:ATP-dependent RecD-like DNA helicase [bacterium]|jgi:exodeoxyribonuclease V alpha subunit|nr:ATP-dependent RecD-like DNA helicase [bacterium]
MPQLEGRVVGITFRNSENGFSVIKVQSDSRPKPVIVVGVFAMVQEGEEIVAEGEWGTHPNHGEQFQAKTYTTRPPNSLEAIEQFLSSKWVKGIGPVYAEKIVTHFGMDTLEVLDNEPERLKEVKGLGKKRRDMLQESWSSQRSIRQLLIFLQEAQLGLHLAQRIHQTLGENAVALIRENPYRLIDQIWGIGFHKADQLAQKQGLTEDHPERVQAGIRFILQQASGNGHTCLSEEKTLRDTSQLLAVAPPPVQSQIEGMCQSKELIKKSLPARRDSPHNLVPYLFLKHLFRAEERIRADLSRILTFQLPIQSLPVDTFLTDWQRIHKLMFSEDQKAALNQALTEKVSIITGGPGTGKSTLLRALVEGFSSQEKKLKLMAPTGRAAKRITEITGLGASTIHSALEFNHQTCHWKHNKDQPIACDGVIVDEMSMVDTSLMASLLDAIPDTARVIFIGDADQLPSVGPGNVLADMINSETIPCIRLQTVFRQSQDSQIIGYAHTIRQGQIPHWQTRKEGDFFILESENASDVAKIIGDLVTERLPKAYGIKPLTDIQVLTPMNKGDLGTVELNKQLQARLNPGKKGIPNKGQLMTVGDKVIQLRNNYTKEVLNGDMGFITDINKEDEILTVTYDDREIEYEASDWNEIQLAYAVTVHKFQGSEVPFVVMPIHPSQAIMLTRNLLYTAITRAKKHVVLVGHKAAINRAIQNTRTLFRWTGLQSQLRGE